MVNQLGNRQGLIKPLERPKSGIQSKSTTQDAVMRSQGLLLTWLVEEPLVYPKIKKYISPEDFTIEPYGKAAQHLLADLDKGVCEPAAIISLFSDEEEQRKVAALFNTKLPPMENLSEKEKALKDVVLAVKRNSYEESSKKLGQDVSSLNRVIEGKKALEELTKTHISLDS
jgi:DNA primase